MALFIVSEVLFFAAFFWAFFNASTLPKAPLEDTWAIMQGVWPPQGIHPPEKRIGRTTRPRWPRQPETGPRSAGLS
jgi:heme/copper-type cytochrome/quinol oxidase subunit 3